VSAEDATYYPAKGESLNVDESLAGAMAGRKTDIGVPEEDAGWSWGCVSAVTSAGRIIWVADAHRDDGKRFVVHTEEILTAFMELEAAIRATALYVSTAETNAAFSAADIPAWFFRVFLVVSALDGFAYVSRLTEIRRHVGILSCRTRQCGLKDCKIVC